MRGEVVCSNSLKVSHKLVESVLLESIRKNLFTEEGLAVFKEKVARLLAEHRLTWRLNQDGVGAGRSRAGTPASIYGRARQEA